MEQSPETQNYVCTFKTNPYHREIIFQLVYIYGHIANPFSPLFYLHCSEYPAPFHVMWPRINNQNILDPKCPVCILIYWYAPIITLFPLEKGVL